MLTLDNKAYYDSKYPPWTSFSLSRPPRNHCAPELAILAPTAQAFRIIELTSYFRHAHQAVVPRFYVRNRPQEADQVAC
jgi:hypothetical protein